MKKIYGILVSLAVWSNALVASAHDKFDILPDLPEPLAAAQASSVSTTNAVSDTVVQSIGHEPNFISVLFSLIFVILLIYAFGIIYAKFNKLGINTLRKQMGDTTTAKPLVISTTPLGSNKTLHVVELDGKRMLIGASSGAIQLIKDLGNYPPTELDKLEYSKIEIPNIRIPKIEIPKIEFPNIGFTKASKKHFSKEDDTTDAENQNNASNEEQNDNFEISEIYEEGPDGIIDKLFQTESAPEAGSVEQPESESHKVDPDEYALYKKYL